MSNPHRLVSTDGGSFHESPFMAVIARIPAGTNFAATGIGCQQPSFQGNFNADRLSLHPSRTFQANISSARCFFEHQFKSIFQNKTIRGQQKIIPKCNFNCWCLLSSQSSGWHLHLCAVKSGAGLSSQSD